MEHTETSTPSEPLVIVMTPNMDDVQRVMNLATIAASGDAFDWHGAASLAMYTGDTETDPVARDRAYAVAAAALAMQKVAETLKSDYVPGAF